MTVQCLFLFLYYCQIHAFLYTIRWGFGVLGFLAAISGPPIGWLVLVAQFPSLLLVGQRLRSSPVVWWQVVYWLIFLLVAAFLWRSTWVSWVDILAAVVWAVIGWSGGIFVELG